MRRFLLLFAVALALVFLGSTRIGPNTVHEGENKAEPLDEKNLKEEVMATPVPDEVMPTPAVDVPVFFPRARLIARVSDPVDSSGRSRIIETVETSMKQPYVRVERTVVMGENGKAEVKSEVAMVANQLLLQKPLSFEKEPFLDALQKAGADEVKEIAESTYLATFTARPNDPRALDDFVSRVREMAGADSMTVEPNYIRKIF